MHPADAGRAEMEALRDQPYDASAALHQQPDDAIEREHDHVAGCDCQPYGNGNPEWHVEPDVP
jgi:hypothetical protein